MQDILDTVKGTPVPVSTLPELQDTEQLHKVSGTLSDSSAPGPTTCPCLALAYVHVQQQMERGDKHQETLWSSNPRFNICTAQYVLQSVGRMHGSQPES